MEIITKQFEMNQLGKCLENQFLIDEDFNVPDNRQDVKRILIAEGKLQVQELKTIEKYICLTGNMEFQILYETDQMEPMYASMEGKIPFEEMIYVEQGGDERFFLQKQEVDLKAALVHPRKIRVKAIVDVALQSQKCLQEEVTVDVTGEKGIYKKRETIELLKLHTSKRDTHRIKTELELPGTKESIGMLLWSDVSNRKLDTKIVADQMQLTGELFVFCFYESPEGKLDWVEQAVPYTGNIECYGVHEGMYHHLQANLEDVQVQVKLDEDGETRILAIEGTLECAMAIYEEEPVEVLRDLYSLEKECHMERKEVVCEQLVLQNNSKCKLMERISVPELQQDVLQICHSSGRIAVEEMTPVDDGISVEGILYVSILYVKSNDEMPFDVWHGMVPFSHFLECGQESKGLKFDISTLLEQLSITLQGGNEIEVKAVLAFRGFFRKEERVEKIDSIQLEPIADDILEGRPSIVGYVVKEGDELWNLAKNYHTSVDAIREMNEMGDRNIKSGDRLLIFKENVGIL